MRQLITSTQLNSWFVSTSRDAQELLPHLVRKLVLASIPQKNIKKIHMPVGDEILLPGYDGEIETDCDHAYIPNGFSAWEMGTGDAKAKAQQDYSKRSKKTSGVIPSESCFVFVTPHVWSSKSNWIKEKRKDAIWKDVRVIDAVDLAAWLEMCPAVGRWLATQFGIPVSGLKEMTLYYSEDVAARFGIPISPELIIAGRKDASELLLKWGASNSMKLRLSGESPEEAAAFFAATFEQVPTGTNNPFSSQILFVSEANSLDGVVGLQSELIVIALTPEVERRAIALNNPCLRIVTPMGKLSPRAVEDGDQVILGPLDRKECASLLCKMGYGEERANRISRESKGSLLALSWLLPRQENESPEWAVGSAAYDLLPLLLAGQWDTTSKKDCEILTKLADRPYQEIERLVVSLLTPNGPLIRRGNLVDWLAWDFAWDNLAGNLDQKIFDRFESTIVEVLGLDDPKLKLPAQDRWLAAIYDKRHPFSAPLRSGLISTVVKIGTGLPKNQGQFGEDAAGYLIRQLFGKQTEQLAVRWCSLAEWLPDLAEANPREFLHQLDKLIKISNVALLFEENGGLFSSSPHVYLLWALERLAWAPEYLTQASLQLGALAELDPGGSLSNRPLNSLTNIYLPWWPNTSADVDARIAAIDYLNVRYPNTAIKLCVSLLPDVVGTSSPTATPQWRKWKKQSSGRKNANDYWMIVEKVVERLLQWAGSDIATWSKIVAAYPSLINSNKPLGDKVYTALAALDSLKLNEADKHTLSETIRQVYSNHRQFCSTDWAMAKAETDRLEALYARLAPSDFDSKHGWLFTSWPELPEEYDEDHAEHDRRVTEEREKVVAEIYGQAGLDGLIKFSEAIERPDSLGKILFRRKLAGPEEEKLLELCLSRDPISIPTDRLFWLGQGYVEEAVKVNGAEHARHSVETIPINWDNRKYANLALAMPATSSTWKLLAEWGDEVTNFYWKSAPFVTVADFPSDSAEAVNGFLGAGRALKTIEFLAMCMNHRRREKIPDFFVPSELMIKALKMGAAQEPTADPLGPALSMVSYYVEQVLEQLRLIGLDENTLAVLEWLWFPVLRHQRRKAGFLHQHMSKNPDFFIQIIRLVYRGENEEPSEKLNDDKARASQACQLLHDWALVPGQGDFAPSDPDSRDEDMPMFSGSVDRDKLFEWVGKVRDLAEESEHSAICDQQIGQVLAHSPEDNDGTWPSLAVRDLIEALSSPDIEDGFCIGLHNRRGVHWRDKGGKQEKALAVRFSTYAQMAEKSWPRTACLLRKISANYEKEAASQDLRQNIEDFDS